MSQLANASCSKSSVLTWRHGSHIAVQNNETEAMLVSLTNLVEVELFSYVNTFFYSNKSA